MMTRPDPNTTSILSARYGHLEGDRFIPAPGVTDVRAAERRLRSHGRAWHLVELHVHVAAHGTTGEAVRGGIEDDQPLACVSAALLAHADAQEDARAWALLGL